MMIVICRFNETVFAGGEEASSSQIGQGEGAGYNLNFPMDVGGIENHHYLSVFSAALLAIQVGQKNMIKWKTKSLGLRRTSNPS